MASNELFGEETGGDEKPVRNGNGSGKASNGNGRGAKKAVTEAVSVSAAPAAATAVLEAPVSAADAGQLTAFDEETSTEPGGAAPLMAAPTSPANYAAPILPERIQEARSGQNAPDIFAGEGLKFARYFTKPGEDVFDTTEWDYRTAAITDEKGKVVFEQKDCEIPKAWSMLATNVVVSKYFRGKVGTPGRENSVKQLVSRVADTIHAWGKKGNYFATETDATAFHDELRYLLLHQYMAFNSPVWFNLGVPGERPQVSACQPYDALVSTPQGLIPIGRLVEENAVGTTVFDANGVTRIVATKANGSKNVLRLHTKAGYTLDVTADHLVWKVARRQDPYKFGKFVEAGTLRAGDQLAWVRTPLAGKSLENSPEEAEAALAGWLQSDGFVGQYASGTNRSLTIEALTVNTDEETWVRAALEHVFPNAHSHTRAIITQDEKLDGKRIRLYGETLRPFIEKWNLMARGTAMQVPAELFSAPYAVAAAYLRSLFQAEGYAIVRENASIGIDMISEEMMRGVQRLLLRFGIYSRVRYKADSREDRKGCWCLKIATLGDRKRFAAQIGFVGAAKQEKVLAGLGMKGLEEGRYKTLEIAEVENLGDMEVYDIQTESGEYLSGNVRVHNCFINSIDDTMESILTLAKTEGMLFKWGSGTGTNFSVLRSSKEGLKGGGTASGPVSFMRGFDAFAGAIKSGGKTRRAAKMVILNSDHPDIEEFIECKADAEKKAHALIEAGYSGAFNVANGAYDSVYFQNANHSVRATDDFMRAVELDRDWSTVEVLTGKISETFRARDLMRKISDAAWVCGDPGMQFDTTANKWHTCPNSGRINASNPCCFTGDTLVAVADGRDPVAFRDLAGQVVPVYAWDHKAGKTVIAEMHNISVKRKGAKVFRVTLDDGSSFRATDDHLIMLRDGSYRQVKDLKRGDSLNPFHSQVRAHADSRSKRRHVHTGRAWKAQYRWIWETANGPQPEGFHIHHRDFNSLNDALSNLELLPEAEHNALHREKMVGDNNPARRLMNDIWRMNISRAVSGENNPHYGKPHGDETRAKMREASANRWSDPDQREHASDAANHRIAKARAEGKSWGRPVGERFERACPCCRQNFVTAREAQIFCSTACRYSPLGRAMTGEKGGATRAGRPLSATHRESLRASSKAAARPEDKRRAAEESLRARCLKAARLLVDAGHEVRLSDWAEMRETARALGAAHVPQTDSVLRFFSSDAELREATALYNHKVVSVEFDGEEDVYDGTVEGHHNFAIVTSNTPGLGGEKALDYSGVFVHNSEYFFLDDSACNLASLNLMRFRTPSREFDIEAFQSAVRVTITAMEIMVGNAAYPTDKITVNSFDYRPLGLGYANLGALLMARGLGYDSDEGRAYAAAITAIMSGTAYHQSAKVAGRVGAFAGFEKNRQPMLRVMQMHRDHVEAIHARETIPVAMVSEARKCWDEAIHEGGINGYRNSQISVLAPTGTIGFLMDCDTTGVEPDIAIVKYKSLVGGGMFKIVNQTVPEALERLGYSAGERKAILDYIEANDTIEGAPGLNDDHLIVFDCAFRAKNGKRTIHYMGHIKMMAAVQPFLSGAISKTVNMPHDAHSDDIAEAYMEAWKAGVKALAIYRDGSKKTQPLSTGKADDKPKEKEKEKVEARPLRRKLPDERQSLTHKFSVGGHEGYLTVGMYPEGDPGEIFITMSKEGSVVSGLMDSFATAISLSLQYGVPLKTLVDKFMHSRFEPSGFTGNPDIPMAKSIMDYLFRYMALKFLNKDERGNVGLIADQPDEYDSLLDDNAPLASPKPSAPPSSVGSAGQAGPAGVPASSESRAQAAEKQVFVTQADAPPCPDCGSITTRNGACYRCANCGTSIGCS